MSQVDITDPQTIEQGFTLVEDILSPEQCDEVGARLLSYASGERPAPDGLGIQREQGIEGTDLDLPPGHDVRKVSGLHADDLIRDTLISHPEVVRRMETILEGRLRLYRADALMKPGRVGSEKGFHQDSPYWPIEPMSLWSCWIPLDDATVENGCMLVIPGSHHGGALPHEEINNDYAISDQHYDLDKVIPVPMKRGTGLFFHSLVVHGTAANRSGQSRRAITMSYMGDHHQHTRDDRPVDYPVITAVDHG